MIDIVVLIHANDIDSMREFEAKAIRIMKEHGGELLSAFEPDPGESTEDSVNEVHCLRFPSLAAFHNYRNDPDLKSLSGLRGRAISDVKILVSKKRLAYE